MEYVFTRKINYYETDQMGVVHHSNYFRFFEEARIAYLENIGYGYDKLEQMGIISPVLSISCDYIKPLKFSDEIQIKLNFITSTSIKFEIEYEIYKDGELTSRGYSKHCYLDNNGSVIGIKKHYPDFYNSIKK